MTESLQWHPVSERMPDAGDPTTLIWFEHEDGNDWTAGYWDGEQWRLLDGHLMDQVTVTHWAQPKGPQ